VSAPARGGGPGGPGAPPPAPDGPPRSSARLRLAHLGARVRRDPTLLAGLALLGMFLGAGVAALLRYGAGRDTPPVDLAVAQPGTIPPGPSEAHPFGMDPILGIDVASSLWRATPNDLALVGAILLIAATVGLLVGAYAGLAGGWVDHLAVGASDLLVGVPPFFLVIVLYLGVVGLAPPGDGLPVFALLFAFVLWPYYARPVRVVAQRVAVAPYVESARAAGAGSDRLLFRHVLPNSLYPVLAQLPIDVFNVFFVLSVFPFVGCYGGGGAFSVIPITPSLLYPEWGSLLAYGACYGWSPLDYGAWWGYLFPAAVIVAFGFMVVLLCDGVERLLDVEPRR